MQSETSTRLIAGTLRDKVARMEPIRRILTRSGDAMRTPRLCPLDPDQIPDQVINVVVDRMLKELTW